jgi:hypothetical protein
MDQEPTLAVGVEIFELNANNGDVLSTDKGRASMNRERQEVVLGNHPQTADPDPAL